MKAKKSLGQHFLKSQEALERIVSAGGLKAGEVVLEIGPGTGALTAELLKTGATVIAVETDERMFPLLRQKFSKEGAEGKFVLIEGSIQDFNVEELKKYSDTYKIVANIPYYITGEIIRKFLENEFKPEKMVLLVQKEVAERVVAQNGKQSILSLSVRAYGVARNGGVVRATDFSPIPKVDSAILVIEDVSGKYFGDLSSAKFFEVVKKAFSYKRKVLTNNFQGEERKIIEDYLKRNKLSPNTRAEDVQFERWLEIARLI